MCQPEAIQQTGPGEPGIEQHTSGQAFQMKAKPVKYATTDGPHQPGSKPETMLAGVGRDQIGGL
ncbi:hypothetical protein AO718_06365 [Aeromonas veronii]|nr:hypothetical protein AO728_13620 [Aeromonas veronii]KRV77665.1 hypothetical protein AO719_14925 [Aeromonas veronii]KRV82481.1 hypothetical protein AO718_06365 [Aeromonas veronii]KRV84622.1 hypothetical protein AO721_08095 [Aeromonas veronii]KRV84904.1 hypothetical protein AO739_07290 [Aeromonas veronii]